ncbi:cytochrome c oxidase assembly factor 3, mitochondrial [Condylostylus longicornis]|uniref:cytochrome c oxidase assembly factor 3, mitochondrial n=1 Tax=Condylostylus longicornis TaxID=2530218 RepID=UPI00244DE759|nr:cytochrome c oxidase assembly factor 3, mitochondrial [Condylostylus longicornis]
MSQAADQTQPKIKYGGETKLNKTQLEFMKIIEQQNLERVQKLQRTRRNNIITGLCLGASVLGIYAYSMFSVAQEKFLDDFEEPKKTDLSH